MSFFYEYKKVIPLNFSASLSYYLFLALAPSFLLVYLFMSYYVNDLTILEETIKLILPIESSKELIKFLSNSNFKFDISLLFVIVICLNIISNGMSNLIKSMDIIFSFKQYKNIKIKSILLSIFMIIIESIGLCFIALINNYLLVFRYLRFLILFIMMIIVFIYIYKFLPSKEFKIKDIINYSIIGSFFISIFILGFNIFIDYYSRIEKYYGSFSIIVVVLILFKMISNIIAIVFFLQYKKIKKSSLIKENRL